MISSFRSLLLVIALTPLCVVSLSENAAPGATLPEAKEQPQAGAPLFTLAASAVKDEIQVSSRVEVKVVTTNTSSQNVIFEWQVSYDAVLAYSYDIRDENGNVPPDTKLHRRLRYAEEKAPNVGRDTIWMGSMVDLTLKPGEIHTDVVDVGAVYDFSSPGVYTIQVRRSAWQDKAWVKSDPITIKVVPAANAQPSTRTAGVPASLPSFSLTVKLEGKTTLSSQDPRLELVIVTKNISDHRIFLRTEKASKEHAGAIYKVDVRNSAGEAPAETEFGRSTKNRDDTPPLSLSSSTPREGGESLRLNPGEDWWDTIMVDKLYTLNKPWQYTLQVRRWDDETETWVKSNTITVTVEP
jgi:hypothetical protein